MVEERRGEKILESEAGGKGKGASEFVVCRRRRKKSPGMNVRAKMCGDVIRKRKGSARVRHSTRSTRKWGISDGGGTT